MTEATVALAFVTFLLVVGAFINILLTRRIQAKERRDRQLREVIDWAVDANKAPFLVETPRWPPESATFESAATQVLLRHTMISDLGEEVRQAALILAAGEYIRNLARQLDGTLASAVEDAFRTLAEHHRVVAGIAVKLSEASGDPLSEYERLGGRNVQYRQPLRDSAKRIISRATELLAT